METVHLFFACDERYLPLCGVTLKSIQNHRDPARVYRAVILHTDISDAAQREMRHTFSEHGFTLAFRNVKRELDSFAERLHTRDYYSNATYYRLLIPTLYPNVKKALYLDSDIILRHDVAELYDTELGDALAGAIPDGFVNHMPILRRYVENRVGVAADQPYFNAGVLLMNLVEMRKIGFEDLFIRLLESVTFRVAQDQDYLNVICRGKVRFLSERWNHMPFRAVEEEPFLIHFNLDCKPWQKDGIPYGDEFWACADATPYADIMHAKRAAYSEADIQRAAEQTAHLIEMAVAESEDVAENERIASRIATIFRSIAPHASRIRSFDLQTGRNLSCFRLLGRTKGLAH